jgi:prolyl-tRNA synthetase
VNAEKTEAPRLPFGYASEPVLDLQRAHFHTPGIIAMEEQAKAFKDEQHNGLPLDHASKFYLYRAVKGDTAWDVGLVLRSDHEPNTVKLRNLIGADSIELVPLEEAEKRAGTKSGFIGPIDLDVAMYVDRSLEGAYNLTWAPIETAITISVSSPIAT